MIIELNEKESEKAFKEITASLSEGFSKKQYTRSTKERLYFGFKENDAHIGLLNLEFPFPSTANIHWMGVKKDAQNKGVGNILLQEAEKICMHKEVYTITVEVLSPKEEEGPYNFFTKHGFWPLYEFLSAGEDYLMVNLIKILSPKIFKWIDLTHELSDKIPAFGEGCRFLAKTEQIGSFHVQRLEMDAGIGTHIDAPLHCNPTGKSIKDLSMPTHPCIVINVAHEAHEGYKVEMPVIKKFEEEHGKIGKDRFVIFYTGWDRFWEQPEKYRSNFPTISKEVAEYLVSQEIAGIGIDTLSPDKADDGFPVHQIVLGNNKFIVENVAHADKLPPVGSYIVGMPLKIAGASEAPMRLVALLS